MEYDTLRVYDGETVFNATLMGVYSGQYIPQFLVSTSHMMHLVLTTDESWTENGFKIYYEVFDLMHAPCSDPGVPDNGYRNGEDFSGGSVLTFGCDDGLTLIGEETLTCVSGQGWGFSAPTCDAVCGGNITGRASGVVYSPNYPWRYDNNLHCAWTIEVSLGMGVKMTPDWTSLDDNDKLIFYDGDREDNDTLIGEFNGGDIPNDVRSSSNVIHLVFTSDESIRQYGFAINYEEFNLMHAPCPDPGGPLGGHRYGDTFTVGSIVTFECRIEGFTLIGLLPFPVTCGGYLPGRSSGVIFSPNYPGQYGNNLNCTWTIEVDVGEGIKISPADFALEEGSDTLMIYDEGNDTLIGEYSGQDIPEEIRSASNVIHLTFTTDDSFAEDGFKLFYDGTT
ncbi:CUB and sushi domain-containing protein 3-like [Branchiostoma floridae x Branchiostoma japonicum]